MMFGDRTGAVQDDAAGKFYPIATNHGGRALTGARGREGM
jgi:hypothetical protein